MKLTAVAILSALPTISLAFAPVASKHALRTAKTNALSAAVTGPDGKPASSKEEDLSLTFDVILSAMGSVDDDSGIDDSDDGDEEPAAAAAAAAVAADSSTEEEPKKAKKKKKKKQAPPAEEFVADVSKLDIRVGTILEAWEHEDADKLFCEKIDIGEDEPRTIATGVRAYYKAEELVGRKVCVLANLKTRKLMGFPSHGMVMCASIEGEGDESKVVFLDPPADAAVGERCVCDGFGGDAATENQVGKKKVLDKVFPDFMTDGEGVATYKGVPLTAGSSGKCIAQGGLANAQVA